MANIVDNLKDAGRPCSTPVALIRWGTTSRQVTITGTLNTIAKKCEAAAIKPPALIVVGKVVNLRKTMKWFENRPLMGKSIVVTRSRVQASDLVERLSELGSDCIECPTIEVIRPSSWRLLDRAIDRIEEYDWLVFTSVNGVDFFFRRFFGKGKDIRSLGGVKTAAIGPATASKLFEFGLKSDIVPETYCAESVVDAFHEQAMDAKKVCLPRAMDARAILPVELLKMGAVVDEIPVYRTIQSWVDNNNLVNRLKARNIDMITFTSSSTVKNFKNMFLSEQLDSLLEGVAIASIGPITAKTACELGFKVDIVANEFTIIGLCEAILDYYS